MTTPSRGTLVRTHLLIATFIFPATLMFLITGAMYTWGIKGSYDSEPTLLSLDSPLRESKDAMVAIVERELARMSLEAPSGEPSLKKGGTSFYLEWTGSKRDVVLEPTGEPRQAKLTVKETSWYRNFVQLHKAKGGTAFKVYAAVFASGLLLLVLSGTLMALQMPAYRRLAMASAGVGLATFVIVYSVS